MIVVVEGPDNAGKTTLATYLAKHLRAVYLKVERPKRGVDLLAFRNLIKVANEYSGWVVCDRHVAISEPIYGTVIRHGHVLNQLDIDPALDDIHCVFYCRPTNKRILDSIGERPQMEGVVENAEAIIHAYDEYMKDLYLEQRILVYVYDYEEHRSEGKKPEALVNMLQDYAIAHKL
jgi:thymidylate kinase